MVERFFRLLSLAFLGIGICVGFASLDHSEPSQEQVAQKIGPLLETIESAQGVDAINAGLYHVSRISHDLSTDH